MNCLKSSHKNLLAAAVMAASTPFAMAGDVALVTNGNDYGDGSLREALASGASEIVIVTNKNIEIMEPLSYEGTTPLSIYGNGKSVKTYENINLLQVTNGANLTVQNLDFEGPGGFSIENQADSPAGKGIFVDVRDDQRGTVKLVLTNVSVKGVANHGVHVSDCNLADTCGGGSGGGGEGSDASISVTFQNVEIKDVGYGKFDADGLRVDERGKGKITFTANDSSFTGVGADGVELDEGNNGSILATITDSKFNDNGGYCDPGVLLPLLPDELEAEFEEGEQTEVPVVDTPDNTCIEVAVEFYPDGSVEEWEFAIDLDDGIDLDEAGSGSIITLMIDSDIKGNLDEGVDYDEEGAGNIDVTFIDTRADKNTDDGYKFTEEDNGGMFAMVYDSSSEKNGGKGFVFEEADNGNLDVTVEESRTKNNDDSDGTGIEAVQEDNGTGLLTVIDSDIKDGIDAEGVAVVEE